MSPLETRFEDFVRSLQDAEIVDEIELSLLQKKANKPDFFFCDRQFIGEMKSLNADTEYKATAIIEKQRERPEFPIFYQPWDSDKILNCLPDGEYVKERMVKAITTGLKKSLKKANKQIAVSKKMYDIQTAEGILIIINDSVEVLSPEIIADRVSQLLQERAYPSGELLYSDIAVVLIVGGLHTIELERSQELMPIVTVVNSYIDEYEAAEEYTQWLQRKWAKFNGVPLVEYNIQPEDFRTSKRNKPQPSKPHTLSDLWKEQYKRNSYLRHLSEDELLNHSQKLHYEMMPHHLRGEHTKPSEKRVQKLWELGTHIMEEFNYRGLDFRKLGFTMKTAIEQLEREGKVALPSRNEH